MVDLQSSRIMSNDFCDRCGAELLRKLCRSIPGFKKGVSMYWNIARGPSGPWERSFIVDLPRSESRPRQPALAGQSDSDVLMEFAPRYLGLEQRLARATKAWKSPRRVCEGSVVLKGDHSLNRRSGNLLHDDN